MKSLTYVSRATRPLSTPQLVELAKRARAHNQRDGITGILVAHNGAFMQLLEGPAIAVDDCFARIADDDRHTNVRIVRDEMVSDRRCGQWTMGLTIAEESTLETVFEQLQLPQPLISMDLITSADTAEALMDYYIDRVRDAETVLPAQKRTGTTT